MPGLDLDERRSLIGRHPPPTFTDGETPRGLYFRGQRRQQCFSFRLTQSGTVCNVGGLVHALGTRLSPPERPGPHEAGAVCFPIKTRPTTARILTWLWRSERRQRSTCSTANNHGQVLRQCKPRETLRLLMTPASGQSTAFLVYWNGVVSQPARISASWDGRSPCHAVDHASCVPPQTPPQAGGILPRLLLAATANGISGRSMAKSAAYKRRPPPSCMRHPDDWALTVAHSLQPPHFASD